MRLIFALSLDAVLAVASLAAADRPDFTGTWRLNAAQSNYPNKNAIPSKLLKIVEMKGDALHYIVERELVGKSSRMDLQTDHRRNRPRLHRHRPLGRLNHGR